MTAKTSPPDELGAAPCYAAVWTVHTPSGPTDACEAHTDKLQRLMQFMGAYTNKTPAPEGTQCANCINEGIKSMSEENLNNATAPSSVEQQQACSAWASTKEATPDEREWVLHTYAGVRAPEYGLYARGRFWRNDGPESFPTTHWLRVPMIDPNDQAEPRLEGTPTPAEGCGASAPAPCSAVIGQAPLPPVRGENPPPQCPVTGLKIPASCPVTGTGMEVWRRTETGREWGVPCAADGRWCWGEGHTWWQCGEVTPNGPPPAWAAEIAHLSPQQQLEYVENMSESEGQKVHARLTGNGLILLPAGVEALERKRTQDAHQDASGSQLLPASDSGQDLARGGGQSYSGGVKQNDQAEPRLEGTPTPAEGCGASAPAPCSARLVTQSIGSDSEPQSPVTHRTGCNGRCRPWLGSCVPWRGILHWMSECPGLCLETGKTPRRAAWYQGWSTHWRESGSPDPEVWPEPDLRQYPMEEGNGVGSCEGVKQNDQAEPRPSEDVTSTKVRGASAPAPCSARGFTQEAQISGSVPSYPAPIGLDTSEVRNLLLTLGVYCLAAEGRHYLQTREDIRNPALVNRRMLYALPYPCSNMNQAQASKLEELYPGSMITCAKERLTTAPVEMAIPPSAEADACLMVPDGYYRFPVEAPWEIIRDLREEYKKAGISLPEIRELVGQSYGCKELYGFMSRQNDQAQPHSQEGKS